MPKLVIILDFYQEPQPKWKYFATERYSLGGSSQSGRHRRSKMANVHISKVNSVIYSIKVVLRDTPQKEPYSLTFANSRALYSNRDALVLKNHSCSSISITYAWLFYSSLFENGSLRRLYLLEGFLKLYIRKWLTMLCVPSKNQHI